MLIRWVDVGLQCIASVSIVLWPVAALQWCLLQVESLHWLALQLLVNNITVHTVLEYAALADAVSDSTLMDACIHYLKESEHG